MTDLNGRRILVLEDVFYLAMDVKDVLQSAGAQVVGPFSTTVAALGNIEAEAPDFAVLDVNLGEGASFDVARALRKRQIGFLFFTGYDASAIPQEFADVQRLEKPVGGASLLSAIERCCLAKPD